MINSISSSASPGSKWFRRTLAIIELAAAAAQRSLDISLNQYRAGLVSYLQVATQQTALLTSQRSAVSLTGRRFVAAVQLVRALRGA